MANTYQMYMDELVKKAPDQIPQARINDLLSRSKGGVTLVVDGNAGCALLGSNLQDGEAEFVTIDPKEDHGSRKAVVRAFNLLKARCGGQSLPYHTCDPTYPS